jgi:cobalt-zinc-cadmium efflux system outer membrane protein
MNGFGIAQSRKHRLIRIFRICVPGLILLIAGCKGIPTPGEKEARRQAAEVTATFRPQGKPALPELSANSSLSTFLTYAMLNQPRVEAAYFDWLASVERITAARSLPDPQITFQMDIQNVVTSVMPGLMMNFPGPGKLRASADMASAQSQAKYFAFRAEALTAAFEVKRAYYQLYFQQEKLRINRETLSLLADLEKLAQAQDAVGKVTLQDVLRAQVEQDRVKTEVADLQDLRAPLLSEFKAALGIANDQPSPPVPKEFESAGPDAVSESLFETVVATNTRLKEISAELAAANAAVIAANKGRVPDFSVGLMADVKMSPTLYRPIGTVSLPIWRDKIAAQVAGAEADRRSTKARLEAEKINLATAFAEKSYLYRQANRTLRLLRDDLLPKQRQSLEVARSGYVAGAIDFFNLTDAEQTLLRFGVAEVEARAQRELALAELSLMLEGMPVAAGMGSSRTPTTGNAAPANAGMNSAAGMK